MAADDWSAVAVVVVARHGQRFPLHEFPSSANWPHAAGFWQILEGRLAQLGAKQHEDLGRAFRDEYAPLVCAPHGERVLVYTTFSQRTILSAHSFVTGLLPGTPVSFGDAVDLCSDSGERVVADCDRDVVRLHVWSRSVRDRLLQQPKLSSKYKLFKRAAIAASPRLAAWAADPAVVRLLDRLWALTGFAKLRPDGRSTIKRLTAVRTVQTQINLERAMGMRVLRATDPAERPLDSAELALVEAIATELWLLKFQGVDATSQMQGGRMGAQRLVEYALGALRASARAFDAELGPGAERLGPGAESSSEPAPPSLHFLSAHDSTLLALLARLNIRDPPVPQFAATLALELLRNNATGEWAVGMRYSHESAPVVGPRLAVPVEAVVTFSALRDGVVSLDAFADFVLQPIVSEFLPEVADEPINDDDDSAST